MGRRSRAGGASVKTRGRKPARPKRLSGTAARPRRSSPAGQEPEAARLASELSAMSEILRLISNSPSDLGTVLQSVAEQAAHICQAQFVDIFLVENDKLRDVAWFGELKRTLVFPLDRSSVSGRSICEMRPVSIDDLQNAGDDLALGREMARRDGHRSILAVPLIRERRAVGTIIIRRTEVRPFEQKNIAMLTNFAAQAVIAIENARLLNELRESLQQQTATADVLKVISRSTFDLKTVLQTLVEAAARLCEADKAVITRQKGGAFYRAEFYGYSSEFMDYVRSIPIEPERGSVSGRALLEGRPVQIPDVKADPEYTSVEMQRLGDYRTALGVPMLREGVPIGVLLLSRSEVRPFTDKQIELVTTFTDQAVIAIENTRLFEAEQQRTRELSESLEQQTATSELLGVISRSSGDLGPVFESVLANAIQVCGAKFGGLFLCEGDAVRVAAFHNAPNALAELWRREPLFRPGPTLALSRSIKSKQVVQIADMWADQAYHERDPARIQVVELGGFRAVLSVPLVKDHEVIGAFTIWRQEPGPFADRQITVATNFANQAVIAIENTRLLNELRQSLEQQTATADVLRVISSSPGELEPVFQAMLENAVRICEAKFGVLHLSEGDGFRLAAMRNAPPAYAELRRREPVMGRPNPRTAIGRAAATKRTVQIADVQAEPGYFDPLPGFSGTQMPALTGARTIVAVPMLKDDSLIGVIIIYRQEVRPFTDKQISLVQNFAAQAVIAIENARLLNELRESLDQQSATADVLKVISRSTFDLRRVLQTLVESAARFCAADNATVIREKDGLFYTAEAYGYSREFLDYIRNTPIKTERGSASGRALVEGRVVHIPDVKADPEYTFIEAPRLGDFRTALCVPMLREDVPIGVLTLTRSEVRPFTDKQIELVTTLADQAAIAIENVRLFDEIQDKSRQLEVASQHKSQFLANMSHELRTPLNAILGYTELMADSAYGEPSEKMLGVLKRLEGNGKHLLGLINDVLDLSKIEAGQLELELSDYCIQDIAQTVRSTLEPLASDKKLAFKVEMASELPPGRGDGRRLTQVLINLVGNAIKFTDAGEVAIKAEANNGSFFVSVRDTGPGISAADQANLFQEFQQADNAITRKKGGTGLGLAISKRIIEMHGGKIWVESQPGQGSTFTFALPVIVELQVDAA